MPKPMTPYGLAKLVEWEGRRNFVYDDADGNKPYRRGAPVRGTLTAGVGHTGDRDLDPWIGKTIPDAVIDSWLAEDVHEAMGIVDGAVTWPLGEYQRDALISFVFNVGPGKRGVKDGFREVKRGGPSGLLRAINEGRHADVPAEFGKWVKSKGKVNDGLVNRRAAEIGLWSKGAFVASRTVEAEAPKPKAALKDGGVLVSLGTVVGTVGVGTVVSAAQQGGQLKDALEPLFGPWAVPIAAGCVVVLIGSSLWLAVRVHRRRQAEAA